MGAIVTKTLLPSIVKVIAGKYLDWELLVEELENYQNPLPIS
jgi:hypothetical protein